MKAMTLNLLITLGLWTCIYTLFDFRYNNRTTKTIASLINLTAAVQYDADYNGSSAAYIALSLLTATVITYFILENTVFDRYLRYAFAVYPVVIWALSAVLAKKWRYPTGVNIFIMVLVIFTTVLSIVRIVLLILYTAFRSLYPITLYCTIRTLR